MDNFHKNLDKLNEFYKKIYYQEVTVFYENNKLFDTDNNRFQENIESYYLTANNTAFKNSITSMKLNENKSSIPNIQNRRFPEQTIQDELFLKDSAIIKEKGLNLLNYSITNSSSKDNKIIFNLNKSVIREPATIGIKNTVSNWHGFGKKG